MSFHLVIMGVSGCGKSTVAEALARRWGAEFLDADAFHPDANVAKMRAGLPLTDEDRAGWLAVLAKRLADSTTPVVLACSALKRAYREVLRTSGELRFVCLHGPRDELERRLGSRTSHFMPTSLLDSQLATLELPSPLDEPDTVVLDLRLPVDELVGRAVAAWQLTC